MLKLKLLIFLLFISISVFGQISGSAGYFNYVNPPHGHEVSIEVKYQLRFVSGEIELKTSFEARPVSNQRRYYYEGKMWDLVKMGIYIDYEKITMVTATVNVSISGPPKDIRIGSIERRFSNGRLLCSAMGISREECSKFESKLNHVNVSLKSVELFTRDYDIESKIRQWIKNNEGNSGNGDSDNGSGIGNGNGGSGNGSGTGNINGNTGNGSGTGNGTASELTEKNKRPRRFFDEIPDDEYIEPMDGRGRELKKDTYPVNPNSNKKNPETIYSGDDWGIKAPNVKIVSKTGTNNSEGNSGLGTDLQENEKNRYPTPEEFRLQQAAKMKQQQDADQLRNEELYKRNVDQQNEYYEGQLSYFEQQNNAINQASDAAQGYIRDTYSRIYEAENQYASYQQNVNRITKFSETDDPDEVLDQYYQKIAEFENSLNVLYQNSLQQINSSANKIRSDSSNPLSGATGDAVQLIGAINANKVNNNERAAAYKRLNDEKRRLLEKIRNDRIRVYNDNKKSFLLKAASSLSLEAENYYIEMADYFDCKSRLTSHSFSTEKFDWVDPDCDEVESVIIRASDSPSGIAFYNAALRKIKNPDKNYQAAGMEFATYALAYEPYNVDYLYLRSKFDPHGTTSNIHYLNKIIEIEPNNITVNEELNFSIAKQANKIETYEKYLEEYPNGRHRNLAENLYENLIKARDNLRLYNKYIADVNENLLLKNYAEASKIHKLAIKNSEYSKTDITDIKAIEDYEVFTKAYDNNDYNLLISYLNSTDYHRFRDKAREKVGSMSLSLGKSYFDAKKYRPAISAYENYKKYNPKGDKYAYAEEQIAGIERRMRFVRNVNRWSVTYIPQIIEGTSSALGIRVGLGRSFYIGFATSYFSMQENKDLISSNWTAAQDPNSESYIFYNPNYYQSNNGQGSGLSFIDPSIKTTGKLIRSLDKVSFGFLMGRRGLYIGTGAILSRTYSEFDFKDFSSGLPEQYNETPNSIPDQNPFVLDQTFSRVGPLIELRYRVNIGLFSIDLGGFGAYLLDEPIKVPLYGVEVGLGLRLK